jgi:hypothetical protein
VVEQWTERDIGLNKLSAAFEMKLSNVQMFSG